jgi:outer membrane autotransporter protein
MTPGLSIWGSAYGGSGTVDGDAFAGTNTTTSRVYGFAAGVDHRVSPQSTIGFALAGGTSNWSVANGLGGGNSEFVQGGIYGSHRFGSAGYVSAALAFAWHQVSTSRFVAVGGETLAADFNANSFGGRMESGYRFAMQAFGVTPYAALQVQSFLTPGYAERAVFGPGAFALTESARTTSNVRTELGVWADHAIAMRDASLLTLRGRVAWVHDTDNDRSISAVFQTSPGSNFTVNGARPAKDGALVSGVAEYRVNPRWAFLAKFDGEFSSNATIYAGTGSVRYAW